MANVRSVARLALLAAALSPAACKSEKAPASAPPAPAAPSAAPAAPGAPANAPDPVGLVPLPEDKAAKEAVAYRLTIPDLQKWGRAQAAIDSAISMHPDAFASIKQNPPRTLDEMIGVIGGQPVIAAALKRSGMSAHDYVLTMVAMNQAIEGYQRKAAGQQLPPNLPPALVANIALVEQNAPLIQQILAPKKAPGQAGGPTLPH